LPPHYRRRANEKAEPQPAPAESPAESKAVSGIRIRKTLRRATGEEKMSEPRELNLVNVPALIRELAVARAKVKVLQEAGTAILDFYNGPLEAKRPDIFQRLMVRLAAALQEQSK
jgi:hypothetical protein